MLVAAQFHPSRYPYELLDRDTDQLLPNSFAVGAPRSDIDMFDGRDRYGSEGEAATVIGVRLASRLRTDASIADYDAALDAEQRLVEVTLELDRTLLHVRLESMERNVSADGVWMFSRVLFLCHHRFKFGER